ncbi:MAG TPA: hypothetical protein VMU09_05915 [Acidimicrobiales bacterium]|nr:hypothetical protein [Acidimicrobiales bacterium]
MIRRALWLGTGAALGAGGTVWVRRRVTKLATHLSPGTLAGDVGASVSRRGSEVSGRVRAALDSGRVQARRREDELWRDLRVPDGKP